jgi:aminoglycoside 2'-N-acetyltransferase I
MESAGLVIASFPLPEVPSQLATRWLALVDQEWPPEHDRSGPEHDPLLDPRLVVLLDGDDLVSSTVVLTKSIEHEGRSFVATGMSAVVTDPSKRGRGHGLHLVTETRRLMNRGGADLALFTCDRPLGSFYVRAGFEVLIGSSVVGGTPDQPFASDQFDKVTFAAFFSPHGRRHAATFRQARIHLYPGTIDRLW